MRLSVPIILVSLIHTAAAADSAQPSVERESPFHLDVEIDPTAYVFAGYSVHVGAGWKNLRLDLGTFGMDLPEFVHGNDGWDASFRGAGVKLQWFPLHAQRALFVDVGLGVSRQKLTLRETGASRADTELGFGIEAGWRFLLPYRFYVTPWAGLQVTPGSADVMLDGRTFKGSKAFPFAAVHLGFRFR